MTVPAHPDFVASIRAMTRSMAVLADLALEDAEALQMAVDEAAILLLPVIDRHVEETLTAAFEVVDGRVRVALSGRSAAGQDVDRAGLPWMMLSALDAGVDVQRDGQELAIAVAISRRREGVLP